MGEAKRRQQYWTKKGQTPPPQTATASTKSTRDTVKDQIHEIKANTERVKKDSEFKRKCQESFAAENRAIQERLAKRDFRPAIDIIATIQTQSGKLSPEQVDLWMDYLIM